MTYPDLSETLHRGRMEALSRYEDWERRSAAMHPGRRSARWRRKHCSYNQHLMKLEWREEKPFLVCRHCVVSIQAVGPTRDLLAADLLRTW
jgi:hypothetical protein